MTTAAAAAITYIYGAIFLSGAADPFIFECCMCPILGGGRFSDRSIGTTYTRAYVNGEFTLWTGASSVHGPSSQQIVISCAHCEQLLLGELGVHVRFTCNLWQSKKRPTVATTGTQQYE